MKNVNDFYLILKEAILASLGPLKSKSRGWQSQNCKLCSARGHGQDRRGRFGIKFEPDSIGLHCFNCQFSARWSPGESFSKDFQWFLTHIGMPNKDVKKLAFEAYRFKNYGTMKTAKDLNITVDARSKWKPKQLPLGSKTISHWANTGQSHPRFLECIEYLNSRKILYPDDLYWCPESPDRVIVPGRYQKRVVAYTSRWIGNPPLKTIPRYYLDKPEHFVYGLDSQMGYRRERVYLMEGVFDAFLIDGISPLGGTLDSDQIQIINSLDKEIVLVPDRDKEGEELFDIALEQNWRISIPHWHKDVKDFSAAVVKYGRILAAQSITQGLTNSNSEAKLKRRMDKF